MRSKECKRCEQVKPVSAFYKQKGMKFDRMSNCKDCHRDITAEYRAANPEKHRLTRMKGHVRRTYGLSWPEYLAFYEEQEGHCAICDDFHELLAQNGLVVDHDHATGIVRGLLCTRCNVALGAFGDSIEGLMLAIEYLRKHQARTDSPPRPPE